MGFLDELLHNVVAEGNGSSGNNWKALNAKEIVKIGGFQPVKDLKPGDVLRFKNGMESTKISDNNKTVTVHRVGDFHSYEAGKPIREYDFTVLVQANGEVIEFAEDSRRWERA